MQHAQQVGKDWTCSSGDMLVERHSDTQTDMLITVLRLEGPINNSNNCSVIVLLIKHNKFW